VEFLTVWQTNHEWRDDFVADAIRELSNLGCHAQVFRGLAGTQPLYDEAEAIRLAEAQHATPSGSGPRRR
jgi:hypothetical protein